MKRIAQLFAPESDGDVPMSLTRERQQARVRVVSALAVLAYLLTGFHPFTFRDGIPDWLIAIIGYIALSAALLWYLHRTREPSPTRRTAMLVADACIITYGMIATGDVGVPLFVLYMSITLGNGLRFGSSAMMLGAVLSLIGFGVVYAISPVWQALAPLAGAIALMFVVLPFIARMIGGDAMRVVEEEHRREIAGNSEKPSMPWLCRQLKIFVPRLRSNRQDELNRERDQAVVRLVNSVFVLGYFALSSHLGELAAGYVAWTCGVGFMVFSAVLLLLTLHASAPSMYRRVAGNIADVSAVSYAMVVTGSFGIPLFILYLSVALGNGFRFGLPALMTSAILSLSGFTVVVALSPVWQSLPVTVPVAVGLALVLLPAYAAHLISQLAKATKRAEEASAAKSRFLARMSHELRTPLNGILGTTELLAGSKRLTRDDRALLDIIRDSIRVSMRQIDNVLDFSKIEAGKLTIERVNFDLHALLNRALRLVRATAIEKNLRLTLRIDPRVPYLLVGDPHHLDEVLLNLLSNAVKFTERGYVSLEAHLLEADRDSAYVRLEVYDTGIGIEPSAIARIFEAFAQEDAGTTRRYGGTGLGTTIAKQLVELMGGKLNVESVKGCGTRFYADIRLARQPAADEGFDSALVGHQVLLISKEHDFAEHFASLTRDWGVSLVAVSSPAEAVGMLARNIRLGTPFNAVIADSGAMFTGNSTHCAGDFLHKAWLSSTPVFLISDVAPDEARLREWGYAAVLPYTPSRADLFSALRSSGVAEAAAADQVVVQVEPWAWRQQNGRPRPRLLIADDNRTNLMILQRILDGAGYDVDTAENGEQALNMLMHGHYKAAVIDMHMPALDGLEVLKQYRIMNSGAKTPVIMLTANATMDAKLESAEAGADAYLTKPATAATVLTTIRKLLDDREVYELRRDERGHPASDIPELPVLDVEVVAELARLCYEPEELSHLIDTFESEGGRLVREMEAAVTAKNQAVFLELIHALKGNGASMGAIRLTQLCLGIETAGIMEFHRDGKRQLASIQEAFTEAVRVLREYTASGKLGPAVGLDGQ